MQEDWAAYTRQLKRLNTVTKKVEVGGGLEELRDVPSQKTLSLVLNLRLPVDMKDMECMEAIPHW
jgi:hypothetical protein